MSFSNDVKIELSGSFKMPERCKVVMLYGCLYSAKHFNENNIEFLSESIETLDFISSIISKLYRIQVLVSPVFYGKNKKSLYLLKIDNESDCKEIVQSFDVGKYSEYTSLLSIDEALTWSFIKGVFLSCGSITDPETDYHLEFDFKNKDAANFVVSMLYSLNLDAKITSRRGSSIVYFKDSSAIEDILAGIGAVKSVLNFMDLKVIKDLRNNINRKNNCETANMQKSINASTQQIEAINLIYSKKGREFLSDDLKRIADFRLENPELSLNEITKELNGEFSKSAIDRRLKKLVMIAEEIKITAGR